jgi:RNA-directed DNA polymerase
VGAVISPLMAQVALSALDEHYARAWEAMGQKWHQRDAIRRRGGATYRLVRYADDFVICVAGDRRHAEALIEQVIAPLGLRLSPEKTRVVHIDEGIDFLGWRIKRQRRGSDGRRFVYTYPSKRSLASVKAKVRQITRSGHNQALAVLLHRLNAVLRGWCAYFRCGVSSRTFAYLDAVSWRRVVRWLRSKYPKRNWRWLMRRHLPGWRPTDGEVTLFRPARVSTTRYRDRGAKIATPWEDGWIARRDPVCEPERLENLEGKLRRHCAEVGCGWLPLCGFGVVEGDGVAEALELRDEAFGLAFGVAAGVVVAAEIGVDLAGGEHVPARADHRVLDGSDRAAVTEGAAFAAVERLEVAAIGSGCGDRGVLERDVEVP